MILWTKQIVKNIQFQAGITVRNAHQQQVVREGVVYDPSFEALLGGWAEVVLNGTTRYATVSALEHRNAGPTKLRALAIQAALKETELKTADDLLRHCIRECRTAWTPPATPSAPAAPANAPHNGNGNGDKYPREPIYAP